MASNSEKMFLIYWEWTDYDSSGRGNCFLVRTEEEAKTARDRLYRMLLEGHTVWKQEHAALQKQEKIAHRQTMDIWGTFGDGIINNPEGRQKHKEAEAHWQKVNDNIYELPRRIAERFDPSYPHYHEKNVIEATSYYYEELEVRSI